MSGKSGIIVGAGRGVRVVHGAAGLRPARLTLDNNQPVNDFVNKILAMVYYYKSVA